MNVKSQVRHAFDLTEMSKLDSESVSCGSIDHFYLRNYATLCPATRRKPVKSAKDRAVHSGGSNPCRIAITAAWVRSVTSSLTKMLLI